MASGGKAKAISRSVGEAPKRRRVGFSSDAVPVSCDAKDCFRLHLAFPGQGLEGDDDGQYTFEPEFLDRVFGEDGKIYGYTGLKINLWLHPATFHAHVQIDYTSKSAVGKRPVTDVLAKLKEVFQHGLIEDRDTFLQNLLSFSNGFEQMIKQHAEVISCWRSGPSPASVPGRDDSADCKNEMSAELKQIVRLELSNPASKDWHARLIPLSFLFIESAQPIKSDPLWEVYIALEGEGPRMKVVGFCNVFQFYHYPDSTRLRISQILVLPPYRGCGFGLRLLEVVNSTASQRDCYDVTMEEPSLTLQKMRDTMDVLRLLALPSLTSAIEEALSKLHAKKEYGRTMVSADSGPQAGALLGFNGGVNSASWNTAQRVKERGLLLPPVPLVEEVRKCFKISKVQFKRCWEQLLFMYLDPEDNDLQDVFREALVERLNQEIFEKDNEKKGVGKRVVDTVNDYDSSKTFVMMRAKKVCFAPVNGCNELIAAEDKGVSLFAPPADEKEKVLQEELKEREEELLGVAENVSRHCRSLGLGTTLLEIWDRGLHGRRT